VWPDPRFGRDAAGANSAARETGETQRRTDLLGPSPFHVEDLAIRDMLATDIAL